MNSSDQPLDLKLPPRETSPHPKRRGELILLLLITGLVGALVWHTFSTEPTSQTKTSAEILKKLALKLEQQDLNESAITVWQEYLKSEGDLTPAKVWYRIASVYQKLESHEDALSALYRAEALTGGAELKDEIDVMVQTSLESLGKFATLQNELKGRVGLNEPVDDIVVAEIGNRKIRASELDREIEIIVERQMDTLKGRIPEAQLEVQRENMHKQFNTAEQKVQFLGTYVAQETLYQKAIQEKLHQSPNIRQKIKQLEKDFLISHIMATQQAKTPQITEQEVKTSYETRKEEFTTPHTITLKAIKRERKEEAEAILKALQETPSTEGLEEVSEMTLKVGYRLPGIDLSAQQLSLLKNVKAGTVCNSVFETDSGSYVFLVETQKPGSQQTFEEVRPQIRQLLQMQQEQKMQGEFLQQLKDEYDVVIHQDAFKPKED